MSSLALWLSNLIGTKVPFFAPSVSYPVNNSLGTVTGSAAVDFSSSAFWSFTTTSSVACTMSFTPPAPYTLVGVQVINPVSGTVSALTLPGNIKGSPIRAGGLGFSSQWFFLYDGTSYLYIIDPTAVIKALGGLTVQNNDLTVANGSAYINAGLLVGNAVALQTASSGAVPASQVLGTDNNTGSFLGQRYSADTAAFTIFFGKSRSGTIGTYTALSSGDFLGRFIFGGVDSANAQQSSAAWIVLTSSAPGAGYVPSQHVWTATNSSGSKVNSNLMSLDWTTGLSTISAVFNATYGGKIFNYGVTSPLVQSQATTGQGHDSITQWTNDAVGAELSFAKFRDTTVGTPAANVSLGDVAGQVSFYGPNTSHATVLGGYYRAIHETAAGSSFIQLKYEWWGGQTTTAPVLLMSLSSGGGLTIANGMAITGDVAITSGVCKAKQFNSTLTADGTKTTTWTANFATSDCHSVTLTTATTCVVSFTAPTANTTVYLNITAPASGTATIITWPATVKGAPPTTATLATKACLVFRYDGTSYWYQTGPGFA